METDPNAQDVSDATPDLPWRDISELEPSDDEHWFLRRDGFGDWVIDGPRATQSHSEDEEDGWQWFAPCESPPVRARELQQAQPADVWESYKTWPADIRAKLSCHDLRRMSGWAAKSPIADWRIDTSAGGPILVYQNCSVIESEQAQYVLNLIAQDQQAELQQAQVVGDGRCMHGVRLPHECKDCQDAVTDGETQQALRSDCYDMIAEALEDAGLAGTSIVESVENLIAKALTTPQSSAPVVGDALLKRAYEVVHHDVRCLADTGDHSCKCDAVPVLRDLESALTGRG